AAEKREAPAGCAGKPCRLTAGRQLLRLSGGMECGWREGLSIKTEGPASRSSGRKNERVVHPGDPRRQREHSCLAERTGHTSVDERTAIEGNDPPVGLSSGERLGR